MKLWRLGDDLVKAFGGNKDCRLGQRFFCEPCQVVEGPI